MDTVAFATHLSNMLMPACVTPRLWTNGLTSKKAGSELGQTKNRSQTQKCNSGMKESSTRNLSSTTFETLPLLLLTTSPSNMHQDRATDLLECALVDARNCVHVRGAYCTTTYYGGAMDAELRNASSNSRICFRGETHCGPIVSSTCVAAYASLLLLSPVGQTPKASKVGVYP